MPKDMRGICYKCEHRGPLIGDAHSHCKNRNAIVMADDYGVRKGWFDWPYNFDPVWLLNCDGFKEKEGDCETV